MREEWFSTPIWFFNYKMRDSHKQLILVELDEYINTHTSADQSNTLGYQSQNLPHSASVRKVFLTEILPAIHAEISQLKVDMFWFNDNWEGAYNNIHVHPKADYSGVWYINVPRHGEDSGVLTLYDPRPAAQMAGEEFQRTVKVQPEEGKVVVFPAWLPHGVGPNLTDERRISISFNLTAYSG